MSHLHEPHNAYTMYACRKVLRKATVKKWDMREGRCVNEKDEAWEGDNSYKIEAEF